MAQGTHLAERLLNCARFSEPVYAPNNSGKSGLLFSRADQLGRPASRLARLKQKVVTDLFQEALIAPSVEVFLDRRKGREVLG